VCDDHTNTVLMMPPLLSHYCLEREYHSRDEKVELANTVEMASLDMEMKVSCVWEERGE